MRQATITTFQELPFQCDVHGHVNHIVWLIRVGFKQHVRVDLCRQATVEVGREQACGPEQAIAYVVFSSVEPPAGTALGTQYCD